MTAKFMWYELLTSQPARAEGFYKSVVGWKTGKMGEGEDAYTIYETDKGGVAGMPVLPDVKQKKAVSSGPTSKSLSAASLALSASISARRTLSVPRRGDN